MAVMNGIEIKLAGETVVLHASKGLFWPRRRVLVVADTHFGKPAAFRHFGVPVPEAATADDLSRLEQLVAQNNAEHLVIAGDFWHAREGCDEGTLAQLRAWREAHPNLRVTIVLGNHDEKADQAAQSVGFEDGGLAWVCEPFVVRHHPEPDPRGLVIAGHVHPGVRLGGFARQSLRAPCFVVEQDVVTLPAFGRFTGLHMVKPTAGKAIYAVADDQVMPVPASRR